MRCSYHDDHLLHRLFRK